MHRTYTYGAISSRTERNRKTNYRTNKIVSPSKAGIEINKTFDTVLLDFRSHLLHELLEFDAWIQTNRSKSHIANI